MCKAGRDQVRVLEPLVHFFQRAHAYSLVDGLGAFHHGRLNRRTGVFNCPYVGGEQAPLVLAAYVAAFLGLSGYLLRRREVT
jgi:hypothetical protein